MFSLGMRVISTNRLALKKNQYESWFSRGNATSLAPIMIGIRKLVNAPQNAIAHHNNNTAPWPVTR